MLAGIIAAVGGLGSLVAGFLNPIAKITGQLSNAKIAAIGAKTEEERIAANERVATLQAKRDLMVSQPPAGKLIDAMVRLSFALPFIVYNGKLLIWDKVMARGATDGLSAELLHIEMIIVGFYFLHWLTKR